MATPMPFNSTADGEDLHRLYRDVRRQTCDLAAQLSDADATAQSMPDASPAKWHLAHTTWFFETMVLLPHDPEYIQFEPRYAFLFNSYYETIGARHARPKRGLLTRPTLVEVGRYREYVDQALARLIDRPLAPQVRALIELGCHHEQQHQELLLIHCDPRTHRCRTDRVPLRYMPRLVTPSTGRPLSRSAMRARTLPLTAKARATA
jgi:DinB superfamily